MRKFLQSRQKKTRINFFSSETKEKVSGEIFFAYSFEDKIKCKKTDEIQRDPPGGHRSTAARCSPRLRRRSSVGGQLAGEVAARVRAIAPPWAASSSGRPTCHGSLGGGPPLVVVGDDLP